MAKKEKKSLLELMAEKVRTDSDNAMITVIDKFKEEPFNLTEEEIETQLEKLKAAEEYSDIKILRGKGVYLFSTNGMTVNYGKTMARIEDKDIMALIADTVRDDSKIYPRATDARVFTQHPYNIQEDIFEDVLKDMEDRDEYSDIKAVRASNEALYLYSSQYLVEDHAAYLAEDIEITQKEVP